MNDLAKVSRDGRRQVVSLPVQFEVEGSTVRVRREGRCIVLEPIEEERAALVPPGSYTSKTLPPLSRGAAAILASVDAVAPLTESEAGPAAKSATGPLGLEDAPQRPIEPNDEPLPGLSPDQ